MTMPDSNPPPTNPDHASAADPFDPHPAPAPGTEEVPDDPLTSHVYDGIREFDNPTPGWWRLVFAATVVFAFGYVYWVTFGYGEHGIYVQHRNHVTAELMAQFAELGELEQDAATLARFVNRPEEQRWLSAGESIFRANCVACHGTGGVGLQGPNLTDEYFIHIDDSEDILSVLNYGAAAGAMPAWQNKLLPNEIVLVSAYVASLRGQNKQGRTAEGKEIPPFFESLP